VRDLKLMLELFDKYGAIPKVEERAQTKAEAAKMMKKVDDYIVRSFNRDPADAALIDAAEIEEAKLVMGCSQCGPELRRRWHTQSYRDLIKRYGKTALHAIVEKMHRGR